MSRMDDARHLFDRLPSPGKRLALIAAILVHVLLALFLIYGIRWQNAAPVAVEVELVGSVPAPALAPPPPPVQAKTPPKPEPPPPPPPKKVTPPKPDIAIKDKPEKKPEPKKPEIKPEPKPTVKYDPVKDMLRREAEQQKRDQLQEALAREEANSKSAQSQATTQKDLADYQAKLRGKVLGNMSKIQVPGNPAAVLEVTQLPSGEVLAVRVTKSSGSEAFDRDVESAIRKSSPLPLPDRPEAYRRVLTLTFRPND